MKLGWLKQIGRFVSLVLGIAAFLFVLLYVFLNVHPVAWQYAQEFKTAEPPGVLKGAFNGTLLAPALPTAWKGKVFKNDGTGINQWGEGEKFPFRFVERSGVLVISYNVPENSWGVRRVRDEVVRRTDGSLLGRITYRLLGDWYMPVGWFLLVPAE